MLLLSCKTALAHKTVCLDDRMSHVASCITAVWRHCAVSSEDRNFIVTNRIEGHRDKTSSECHSLWMFFYYFTLRGCREHLYHNIMTIIWVTLDVEFLSDFLIMVVQFTPVSVIGPSCQNPTDTGWWTTRWWLWKMNQRHLRFASQPKMTCLHRSHSYVQSVGWCTGQGGNVESVLCNLTENHIPFGFCTDSREQTAMEWK